mgnify:CR=1 FL=1
MTSTRVEARELPGWLRFAAPIVVGALILVVWTVYVLSGAARFQIVTTEPDGQTGQGFNLITMNLDRDKLSGIVRSCR